MADKKKILIAEDEEGIRIALAEELRNQGLEVIEAEDGQKALDMALANHPDSIILDFIMPKMHGKDVLKKLLMDDWGSAVPVIILTNYTIDVEVKKMVEEKEQIVHLDKTEIDIKQVVDKIKEMVK